MKRLIPVLLLLTLCGRASATASWTFGGQNGVKGGSVASLTAPSVLGTVVPAHACIVAIVNAYNQAPGSITDTSGDTPTRVIANTVGGNFNNMTAWVFYNVAGNSLETVTNNYSAAAYATVFWYYVTLTGGNCTSSQLDLTATGLATTVTSGAAISNTITTSQINSASITTVYQDSAALDTATVPSGFTEGTGGIQSEYGDSAANSWTSTQTGLSVQWSGITVVGMLDMAIVTIDDYGSSATNPGSHMMTMGVGD